MTSATMVMGAGVTEAANHVLKGLTRRGALSFPARFVRGGRPGGRAGGWVCARFGS